MTRTKQPAPIRTAGGLVIPSAQATISSGEAYTQTVIGTNGNCTIPLDARAVAMNVTIANGTANSYLTVWPSDVAQPTASNLNWPAGTGPIPNKVDVGLSADGRISFYNNGGSVDILGDVVGYYVDHNHDDRYYTKAQTDAAISAGARSLRTDTYSPYAMQSFQPALPYFLPANGACIYNSQDAGGSIYLVPLAVPVGARLITVDVATYDGAGSVSAIVLKKTTVSTSGSSETIASGGGSLSAQFGVRHDVLSPSGEVVAPAPEGTAGA